jgi:Ca-activated chloride channel family protein
MHSTSNRSLTAGALLVAMVIAACGGGAAVTPVPTAAPGTTGPVVTNAPIGTNVPTGPPHVEAAAEAPAGSAVSVTWTGPNGQGDFVTIVRSGTSAWTNEDYFYTTEGSPANLTAPSIAGNYEIWYVSGADKSVLAGQEIKLTPFAGGLTAPDSVVGNTEFDVAWVGPNGPGDYVTIVKAGTEKWTIEDYFYTTVGPTGQLLAPVAAGAYEILYVIGSDSTIQARRPITVTVVTATVSAPNEVPKGAQFEVSWTGPNGPGDFITIVVVGAPASAYNSYFDTNGVPTGSLTAPDVAGNYEVRYVAGQSPQVVLGSRPIKVN